SRADVAAASGSTSKPDARSVASTGSSRSGATNTSRSTSLVARGNPQTPSARAPPIAYGMPAATSTSASRRASSGAAAAVIAAGPASQAGARAPRSPASGDPGRRGSGP